MAVLLSLFSLPIYADAWQDSEKALGMTGKFLEIISSINRMRSEYSVSPMQMQIKIEGEIQKMNQRQEEWNRWNGLISLISADEKKIILKYNTMSDKELAELWFALKKSTDTTQTFPAEWLMPSKYDSLTDYIRKQYAQEQIGKVMRENDEVSRKVKQEFERENPNLVFIDKSMKLNLDERLKLWENTDKQFKEIIRNYLKGRRESFQIETIKEYEIYRNYVIDEWDGYWNVSRNATKSAWSKYLKQKDLALSKGGIKSFK